MNVTKNDLNIRKTIADDAPMLCQWWNDGELMKHVGFPLGLNTTEDKIRHQIANPRGQNFLILEIAGESVGEAHYMDKGNDTVEIGIKICRLDLQNMGYGTAFTKMIIEYLFDVLGYEKIVLGTDLDNTRAQRVYEKIGFKRLGEYKNTWTDQLGNPRGHVDYELLKKDYMQQRDYGKF